MKKKCKLRKLHWVKLYIYPVLAQLAYHLGVSFSTLGYSFLDKYTLIAQSKIIGRTIKKVSSEKSKEVYFLTMLGGHAHNLSVEIVLAWGLKDKGHKPVFIIDDATYPIAEDKFYGMENSWERSSCHNYIFGKKMILNAGFELKTVSEIINVEKYHDTTEYQDVIFATLCKHYKSGVIDERFADLTVKTKMVETAVNYSIQIGEYLVQQRPAFVVMSHGIYSTWGPQYNILRGNGIDVLIYSKGKEKGTERFNWNQTTWNIDRLWTEYSTKDLTTEEENKINSYIEDRIEQKNENIKFNLGGLEEKENLSRKLGIDLSKKIYIIFTNNLWDAASVNKDVAFSSQVEWVFETIEWFRRYPEKQLIIRIHPAEYIRGTNVPFKSIITEKFRDNLPSNVKIIDPAFEVNSWSLIDLADVGLVYTTTVGFELPLRGKPSLVLGNTHYRGKGFTIDIESKEAYFQLLSEGSMMLDVNQAERLAKKYCFLLFKKYPVPFQVFNERKWTDVNSFSFNSGKDLKNKDYFEELIRRIVSKTSIEV